VVADQANHALARVERGHAVVGAGRGAAVAHQLTGAPEGDVGEARGQQQLATGGGLQRAVAAGTAPGLGLRRAGHQRGQRDGGTGAAQERAPADAGRDGLEGHATAPGVVVSRRCHTGE
jgi:hypothetical protein